MRWWMIAILPYYAFCAWFLFFPQAVLRFYYGSRLRKGLLPDAQRVERSFRVVGLALAVFLTWLLLRYGPPTFGLHHLGAPF
jgi:hypothetical protein